MKTFTLNLARKKGSLCILAGIGALSLFVIFNSNEKINENNGGSYAVKIRHYGIDAQEMERSVTIPLEDALFAITGVMSIQSSSENSLSNVFVRFKPGTVRQNRTKGRYEAVRDAAQRVYETLPSSAQRPEISSSGNSRIPVWSAAFFNNSAGEEENTLSVQMLEKIVKPRLESLEGAGEVIVSGVGLKEIFIILDQEKLGILGLEPNVVSSFLGMNDYIFSGGKITEETSFSESREIIITVDSRYEKPNSNTQNNFSLDNALIPVGEERFTELSQIALIREQERQPDILSRLNGRKTANIAIMGRYGADLRKLSSNIKKELSALELPMEYTVLSDLGAEEAAAFRSVINAALTGAIMVALISFLLNSKKRFNMPGLFCALAIPFICLVSAAVLSASGFSVDRLLLSGIAAGVGTAVDAVILCSEKIRKCKTYDAAAVSLQELAGPLIAGAATTAAALLPLSAIEDGGAGIIASAIFVVTLTALILSLTLLPSLLLWDIKEQKLNRHLTVSPMLKLPKINNIARLRTIRRGKTKRFLCKFLAANVRYCIRHPVIIISAALALTVTAILALVTKGVDTSSYASEDSVYGQVEFDGGLLAEEVDRLLASYSGQLLNGEGIKNIETGARTGSGSLLVSFDPKLTNAQAVRDLAKQTPIPGGFVFFHENSSRDRYWEILVYGDEDQKCREIAQELAYYSAGHPLIREQVLNFKQGSKKLILLPDRELFAEAGVGFSSAAEKSRLGVYGPVAYKRIDSDGETDVRIRTGGVDDFFNYAPENTVIRQSKKGTMDILVSGALRVNSVFKTREETEPASIRRNNRRRTASITVATEPMDPRRVKKELVSLFEKADLPPGYSIEFDPEAIQQAQALSATVLSLVMAVIFCYMIIASINESFTMPLVVLCAIPPSLSIPALCLFLSGSAYNSAVACAFIAVSGMTVNAAVLCVDGVNSLIKSGRGKSALCVYLALRKKIPALLSTTGTTVAGAVPFLFLTEGANTLIRTLSLTSALGVACSCICSLTVIPSILTISQNITSHKKLFRLCGI